MGPIPSLRARGRSPAKFALNQLDNARDFFRDYFEFAGAALVCIKGLEVKMLSKGLRLGSMACTLPWFVVNLHACVCMCDHVCI